MDNSTVDIMGYVFHGWQAKAVFLSFLGFIFFMGFAVGNHVGANKVLDHVNKKLDDLQSK